MSQPLPPTRTTRPKVIYVMGPGRSGSTVLGVALGNCAGIFYAGELDKWLLMFGVSMHERAENMGESTVFWRQVREHMNGASQLFGRDARNYIEHSSSVLRVRGLRARRRLRRRYRRVTADLYRVIIREAQSEKIVDTSHFPLRARELQNIDSVDLYLLYLVRDPQSVVASWGRPGLPEPQFSSLTTNAYLWLTHVLSTYVFLRQPRDRRLFVVYEDFIADPGGVIGEILRRVDSPAGLPDFDALRTGRPYHGNRVILSDVVRLRADPEGPRQSSLLTSVLQLPWRVVLSTLRPVARRPRST